MAKLWFKRILNSSVILSDAAPNWYSSAFTLPGLVDDRALLMMHTNNVHYDNNFVTINAPDRAAVNGADRATVQAFLDDKFVGTLLRQTEGGWTQTTMRVEAELVAGNNTLGIHCRNQNGGTDGNRDDIAVQRIYILYPKAD